ncbi:MAG TPA: hypothetical protein DCE42_08130, partial [Myxococcales bacterium]|nr:hypothetical protein [Myxococcales bacterium]
AIDHLDEDTHIEALDDAPHSFFDLDEAEFDRQFPEDEAPVEDTPIAEKPIAPMNLLPTGKSDAFSGHSVFLPGGEMRIQRLIGKGGVGYVYSAIQNTLVREVALKQANPNSAMKNPLGMLLHEGIITGHLEHPNIIPLHLLSQNQDEQPILVMKFVEGESWTTLYKHDEHPFWEKTDFKMSPRIYRHVEILMEICKTIEFAHSKGIVHRDIKMDNVMIGDFGQVYLVDWGIARPLEGKASPALIENLRQVYKEDGIFGTPIYMAPEMITTRVLDERTDVYLLGATLHHLLTGSAPHKGSSLEEILLSVATPRMFSYDADVPLELALIAQKAMAFRPDDRFQHVKDLRQALLDYTEHMASFRLCDIAEERFQHMQQLYEQFCKQPQYNGELHKVFTECRFSYLQALHAWEENPTAQQGLEHCLRLMFDVEIQLKNFEAASALLKELPSTSDELAVRLTQLRTKLDDEESAQRELIKIKQDQDLSVSTPQRNMLFLSMGLLGVAFLIIRTVLGPPTNDFSGHRRGMIFAAALTGIFGIGVLFKREALLANRINKQFTYLFTVACTTILLHRVFRGVYQSPMIEVHVFDLLLLAVFAATAAIALRGWMFVHTLIFLASLLVIALFPKSSYMVMTISITLGWFVSVYFLSKESTSDETFSQRK